MIAGNPGLDFFDQNPVLRYKTEMIELIENLGKEEASRVAWAVYMVEHPESPLFRIPLTERIEEVEANYGVNVRDHEEFRSAFARIAMPKEVALFKIHMEKLEELTLHLEKLDLIQDNDLSKYVKIMDKLPRIWTGLEKVKTNMIDQQNKKQMYGGASRSARERR